RQGPLNTSSHRKLLIPAGSGASNREPALTCIDAVTTGAARFSRTMTVIPLGKRWRVMPGGCAAAAPGIPTSARTRPSLARLPLDVIAWAAGTPLDRSARDRDSGEPPSGSGLA